MFRAGDTLVGLDVGSSKVCVVVGEITEEGGVDVIAVGKSQSEGMRNGAVVNIDRAVRSIRRAVDAAEKMADVKIDEVIVGVTGSHIKSSGNHGQLPVPNPDEITQEDIDRVLEFASTVKISDGHQTIHVLPQEYTVDDQDGIQDPLGMAGIRLEVDVHIVTGQAMAIRNLVRCCEGAGLSVVSMPVLAPIASAEAVLNDDERKIGVAVLDMGGGTSEFVAYHDNCIKHSFVLPMGGNLISSDLASGLRTSISEAERIKEEYGSAMTGLADGDGLVEVPAVGGGETRTATREYIASIIEPRATEILNMIGKEIDRKGLWPEISGIVLTGGAARLDNLAALAEDIFDTAVRVAGPVGVGGLVDAVSDPRYATGVGLILFAARKPEAVLRPRPAGVAGMMDRFFRRVRMLFGQGVSG